MKLSWPHVAVIGIIVAGVVALAALGRDTSALIALGTLLLAGIGLIAGSQLGIRDQTNGNTTRMLSILEAQGQLLAQMQPLAPTSDSEVVGSPPAAAAEQPPDRPAHM